jgi:hypothetical protein
MGVNPYKQSKPTPKGSGLAFLWLPLALTPSVVALVGFNMIQASQWSLPILVFIDFLCSLISAAAIMNREPNKFIKFAVTVMLFCFFFGLNFVIVVFAGCSGMVRLAP